MKKWKFIAISVLILFIGVFIFVASFDKPPAYGPTQFYNRTGRVHKIMKVFADTITPTTGNGYSMDISAAGFTSVIGATAMAQRNTGTATSVANVGIKSFNTTTVVFNITEGNPSLINILGNNVLLGPATVFSPSSGLLLHVLVIGY